jgi:hypothetical protein
MPYSGDLCPVCKRGYLVRETWADRDSPEVLYCNNCFRRPIEEKEEEPTIDPGDLSCLFDDEDEEYNWFPLQ